MRWSPESPVPSPSPPVQPVPGSAAKGAPAAAPAAAYTTSIPSEPRLPAGMNGRPAGAQQATGLSTAAASAAAAAGSSRVSGELRVGGYWGQDGRRDKGRETSKEAEGRGAPVNGGAGRVGEGEDRQQQRQQQEVQRVQGASGKGALTDDGEAGRRGAVGDGIEGQWITVFG